MRLALTLALLVSATSSIFPVTQPHLRRHLDGRGTLCENTCEFAFDFIKFGDRYCDDGGANSQLDACDYGTDCGDCGPRPALHVTHSPRLWRPQSPARVRLIDLPA